VYAPTMGGGDEANNLPQEQPSTDPLIATTMDDGEANNIVEEEPSSDPMNTSTIGGGDASNIVEEHPLSDPINATTMGGGEDVNIAMTQPSTDPVNASTMVGEAVQSELATEGATPATGSCELPETLDGPGVSDGDDDWNLIDDDVGGCEISHPPNHASDESIAPLPSSNTCIVLNARLADIPVYDDGSFEEVYATSIASPLKIVENQFRQLVWNDTPLEVHQPATNHEV